MEQIKSFLSIHDRINILILHYRARAEALKRLAWFLSNEQNSNEKLPIFASLDVTNLTSIFIVDMQRSLDEDLGRSVFQVKVLMFIF